MATYVKLTIKMPNEVHDELEGLARQRGTNVTGLIKRAVALDKYVWEHRDAELLVRDGDHVRQVVLF